jgi:hypothetical protein
MSTKDELYEEEEEELEEDDELEEDELDDEEDDDDQSSGREKVSFTPEQQKKLENLINQTTAKERRSLEKRLKKLFGTSDLDSAAEYYKAGFEISKAAQAKPTELVQRLRQQQQQQGVRQPAVPANDVQRELNEIRELLSMDREQKAREIQETQAKAEFGELYDEHIDDIEDLAEERGLSLVDAAAVVLRPKLKELIKKQTEASRDKRRKRRVEGTSEGASGTKVDYASKLTPKEKRTATKMGLTLKQYYEHAKAAGNIE